MKKLITILFSGLIVASIHTTVPPIKADLAYLRGQEALLAYQKPKVIEASITSFDLSTGFKRIYVLKDVRQNDFSCVIMQGTEIIPGDKGHVRINPKNPEDFNK